MMSNRLRDVSLPSKKLYEEIVDDILDRIAKGISKEKHLFIASKSQYSLESHSVRKIVAIEGIYRGERHTFENGSDYLQSAVSLSSFEWTGTVRPDDKTEFKVSYVFGERSGLSDTNPGSVLRTIVEAISKELAFLYEDMDRVYKSGFLDTAKGNALDLVTSLIGIHRKQPTRSMGSVVFWRDSDPPEIAISGEPVLFDGRDTYPLKGLPLKVITKVTGVVNGIQYTFTRGKDYDIDKETNSIIWLIGAAHPEVNTPFSVDYTVFEKLIVPKGTLLSTSPTQTSKPKLFETMQEIHLQKSATGKWVAEVQARSQVPGQQGNLAAGAITLMPNPPIGIEHVINLSNLAGGADYEDDESLRGRARHALELAGKATIGSLRTALEGVEGLHSPPLIEENPDGIPGLTKVVIDGGDENEIRRVIEDTRAAGVRVEFSRPRTVYLDFEVTIVPKKVPLTALISSIKSDQENLDSLKTAISTKIKNFVSSLRIGDDLVYNQLLSAALLTDGVHDVKQVLVDVYREGVKTGTSSRDNIESSEDERLYPRTVEIKFENDATR